MHFVSALSLFFSRPSFSPSDVEISRRISRTGMLDHNGREADVCVCVEHEQGIVRGVCVCETHIKTIAQFDCTSYPIRAHSDPLICHQVEKIICLTFLSWMPCFLSFFQFKGYFKCL